MGEGQREGGGEEGRKKEGGIDERRAGEKVASTL